MATPSVELTWPPPNTQEHLFDLYFAHIHSLFPMVKSVPFTSSIDIGVRKEQDEFLTLSIFATASLYHGEQNSELFNGAGNSYFSAAKQCIGTPAYILYVYSVITISNPASVAQMPSLAVCQGLTLLSYYRLATGWSLFLFG